MSHLIWIEPKGHNLRVILCGELSMEAYEHIASYVNSAIEEHDIARLLLDLTQFDGREPGAALEKSALGLPHLADIKRVAFIGGKYFERRVQAFCEPFESATIRYFHTRQHEAAEEWIHEGVE